MPDKYQFYAELADRTARKLTDNYENWTAFLTTAGRMYKYSFAEQLMIYAQRPDATACAEYDVWNRQMGRYIRRGSTGIALVDTKSPTPRLRYVFDVADTGYRPKSREVHLWAMEMHHAAAVSVALDEGFHRNDDTTLPAKIEQISTKLADEYWSDFSNDILAIVDNSTLGEYDIDNIGVRFRNALAVSTQFSILSRCGMNTEAYLELEDFHTIMDFDTSDTIYALGTAVSDNSEMVLREIERAIKNYERESEHERTELHESRGLSVSQPDLAAPDEAVGQIRDDAAGVPAEAQTDFVQPDGAEREPVSAPDGDRPDSEPAAGADDAGVGESEWGDGDDEGDEPDDVGADDEQSESPGRGNDSDGTDLRITETDTKPTPYVRGTQISIFDMIPSEAEQIASINEAERVKPTPFAFSVPEEVIAHVLRLDGNHENARMEVATEFSKSKSPEELAAFLQNLFHDGCGIVVEEKKYAMWYAEEGIRIAVGDSARYTNTAKVLPWSEVVERIGTMLDSGTYATNVELAEMRGYEVKNAAKHLWFMHKDMSDEARERFFDPSFWKGSYDESTEMIASVLEDDVREVIINETARFAEEYAKDNSLMRFRLYAPDKILAELRELDTPRREYRSSMREIPPVGHFITEDEIRAVLFSGGNMAGGDSRIAAYFRESHTLKEQAGFLRKEFGIGGRTPGVSNAWHSSEMHDGKGIALKKQDCPDVHLTWEKVAKRVQDMVKKGRFFTLEDEEAPELDKAEPDLQAQLDQYVPIVREMVEQDTAYRNACGHSDRENVRIECTAAVRRAVLASEDMELLKLFSDDPDFRESLHETVFIATYDQLHELLRLATQENITNETALYTVGDTVYLDNRPFEIVQLTDSHVHLLDPALAYPIERVESIENFHMLLQRDYQNGHITDYLSADLDMTDTDLQEILIEEGGLLTQSDKETISGWFQNGDGNTRVAERLADKFTGTVETMALMTGENADYRATARGLEITIEDKFLTEQFSRWEDIAPVLRAMYEQERDGFTKEVTSPKQEAQAVPAPEPEKPETTTETVAFYPAEENHMPFDVVIQTLKTPEPTPEPPPDTPTEAELDEAPISIQIGDEWHTFPNVEAAEQASLENFRQNLRNNATNFHITDDNLGAGGPKAKYQANITAIKLLQYLESNGFQANSEQQELLSRYVGWGGLADAFDPNKPNWQTEYIELQAILTPEEYEAARASTLNAHYTSPTVVKAIYEAVGNMGFQSGNILEPSMGVGNFFGLLPESMSQSRLYGVELDSITGRIARQLYPKANITVAGFETTDRRDFFDLAIGNVPFGNYKVNDKAYNKLGFTIHNYFFAKALDQVRPGGVVAFVTSRYTMDSESPEVRRYLAERADLLGAIRLPNNAFKANAGTEVTTDIIFLQKRDRPMVVEPDWVHLGLTEDSIPVNSYFIDHPEMVLGTLQLDDMMYGGKKEVTCVPIEGANLADQLHEAVQHIHGTYTEVELPDLGENEPINTTIPADPNVKNYSFTLMDGEVYFRENSIMVQPDLNATAKERVKGMVELRDCVHTLINRQLEGASDVEIHEIQAHLNTLYDNYTMQYGLLNDRANRLAFADDSSYYLLCSLEILNDDQTLKRKADIFSKRTIKVQEVATSVDTAAEALAVSIAEKACVDLPYMSGLSGKPSEELISDLHGVIFQLPEAPETYVTADEYLSGNVREKLRQAENAPSGDFSTNIEALTAAIPKDLDASEIEVRLGATWIEPEIVKQFMFELLKTPYYCRHRMDVQYSECSGEWNVSGKSMDASNIASNYTYGTDCANAYRIIEDTLNLRDVRIYDVVIEDGPLSRGKSEHRVLNLKETTLAQQKQQAIKDAFRDWIWQDPDRREMLVAKYNVRFNSIVPRTYNGEHIVFHGMNPEITLREHQKNAVAHILYGGNTLLAHEVGAGKTFTMVASSMESKRLGLCSKPMFAVPNHLTEQWASEFLRLYPSANILVTTKKDFEPANRKKFCARIATGSYDAIIIGHSQFEKIPISAERQERLLREQIAEITEGITEMGNARKNDFTVKQMERTRKGLQVRLEKLTAADRKDDVITFEQLGVDRLYVDETHNYKNSFIFTKMRNVAGLSTTDAQKSADMLMKCRYLDEITGSRGVVFATGTPVSNSMTELYVMMRYLQNDTLKDRHLQHFDAWASTFGETVTAIELAPEGTGYRARTRFAKFFNLPELMNLFRETADIKTSDQLNLPTPLAVYHNVVAEPTEIQRAMVQELSMRASVIHEGGIDPKDDNMLKVSSDGRKLGLDQRIINPILPDEPGTKVNLCVENIFRIWEEGKAERLTQLVFSDLSTPKTKTKPPRTTGTVDAELRGIVDMVDREVPEETSFNVYEDIRQKLVERGVPREEIAFIHEADTEVKKKELFAKVRSGSVRVLIGSTAKMGSGTNCQDRLIALHDLDAPWRPGDLEQRKGRIVRQGNMNPVVQIYRYVTNATFDAYLWQTLENKQRFISQIMTSKSPVRSCEDVDEASLSYAEVKALCAGDPRIRERMDLEVEVNKLKMLKASHQSRIFKMQDEIKHHYPETIASVKQAIDGLEKDQLTAEANKHPADGFIGMVVRGDTLTDKDNAGAALLEACKEVKGTEPVAIGTYRGFQMSLALKDFGRQYILTLKSRMSHVVELGQDVRGNLIRMDNALAQIPSRIEAAKTKLQLETEQLAIAQVEVTKPFPQEDELRTKVARLVELDAVLNLDNKTRSEPEEQEITKGRPSVLERIREPLAKAVGTPEKKKVKQQEVL